MRRVISLFFCLLFISAVTCSYGQSSYSAKQSVRVSATIQYNPPGLLLSWPSHPEAISYSVYRKSKTATSWGSPLATLPATATSWQDFNINIGEAYEYQIYKTNSSYPYTGNGYIFAGIEYPVTEQRGTIILIVDSTYLPSLSLEIRRLEIDMICDGWRVIRHEVARTDSVPDIKALIINDVNNNPDVRAVFLLGHVPVPYSGNINPDGHSNHIGAWPADLYYGEINGAWTDVSVNNTTASRPQNHNIPGDGKFDQSIIPSDVDLEVGRVDLFNMPAFAISDVGLIKRYLDKNHHYRTGMINTRPRGVIDDNFTGYTEAFAANGWRNFSAMFGASNVIAGDYFTTMATENYLWSYGCGGGTYTSASGIGNTAAFANDSLQNVFTILFGSYFGDWDSQNNFLRAPLASRSQALVCFWAGRPNWHLHHMALGEHIGYSTRLSQNNSYLYNQGNSARNIHVALMGDPTLRMHVVKPPAGFVALNLCDTIFLSWSAPTDTVAGYHLYRSDSLNGNFVRLNNLLINDTCYIDSISTTGKLFYMVKAMKLETNGSGSYYNLSPGIIDSVIIFPQLALNFNLSVIQCYGNSDGMIDLNVSGGNPPYGFSWSNGATTQNLTALPSGLYSVTVTDNSNCLISDSVILTQPPQLTLTITANPDFGNNCTGEAVALVTGGVSPYAFLWNDPAQQTTSSAYGLCAGWYTLSVSDSNGCVIADSVFVENQAGVNVDGLVYYENISNTPLSDVYVSLTDSLGAVVNTDTSKQDGTFGFTDVQQGNYLLASTTARAWGGVNSTDALAIMYHFVGISFLDGLRLEAADVNASGYVNSSDALYVQQRFIGIVDSFPAGDYLFENKNIAAGTTNITEDIAGLCYGDVNASFIPSSKSEDDRIRLIRKDTLFVSHAIEFDIPLTLESDPAISAISLGIRYPDNLLNIMDISINSDDNSNLLYKAAGGKLLITWYSLDPLKMKHGETLLLIKCIAKRNFEEICFDLSDNCELAGVDALPIRNSVIGMPCIKNATQSSTADILISSAFPNPFTDYTEIGYTITKPGTVECLIYDAEGRNIVNKISRIHLLPGRYKIILEGNDLAPGINFCKIIYSSEKIKKPELFRLIVNK